MIVREGGLRYSPPSEDNTTNNNNNNNKIRLKPPYLADSAYAPITFRTWHLPSSPRRSWKNADLRSLLPIVPERKYSPSMSSYLLHYSPWVLCQVSRVEKKLGVGYVGTNLEPHSIPTIFWFVRSFFLQSHSHKFFPPQKIFANRRNLHTLNTILYIHVCNY